MTDPTLDAIRQRRDAQRRVARSVTISQAQTEQDVDTLLDRLAAVEKRAVAAEDDWQAAEAKLAACEARWAFAKSHDSELDHVARIQQLEAKLAACNLALDGANIYVQQSDTARRALEAKLARAERVVEVLSGALLDNDLFSAYLNERPLHQSETGVARELAVRDLEQRIIRRKQALAAYEEGAR